MSRSTAPITKESPAGVMPRSISIASAPTSPIIPKKRSLWPKPRPRTALSISCILARPPLLKSVGGPAVLIAGAFDEAGSPTIKIRVSGDRGSRDYAATIDTGFTGFVALPLVEMVPLGLSTDPGAASVMLGDGTIIENLVARGSVILGSHLAVGNILLDETSADVLIGMAFLRAFAVTLIVTDKIVALCDAAESVETVAELI